PLLRPPPHAPAPPPPAPPLPPAPNISSPPPTAPGPATPQTCSPPISVPFTRILVFSFRNSLLTNLYGAVIRVTASTCGIASTLSRQGVTSPTPTTPITTRSSPSIECTL